MQPNRPDTKFAANIKERSGWWAPLAVIVVVVLFSIFVLLYYLAPSPVSLIEEHPSLSLRADRISVVVGDLALKIPANYLVFASERRGGARREIDLAAMLPDFHGYSDADRGAFSASGSNSPIVHIKIREEPIYVPEATRFSRVYLGKVTDPRGIPSPFGLLRYEFRDDSGYRGEDLFVGRERTAIATMRCERAGTDVPSPNCLRSFPLAKGAALSYRFKRARLSDWREISHGVNRLIVSFEAYHGR